MDLDLEQPTGKMHSSEEFNDSKISDEDSLDEELEQLDGLISSIAEASVDLDDLNNLLSSSENKF